jgi:hypothetical protein
MFSYNTSVHEGTRYTPHELVFGKVARVPSSDPPLENETDEDYSHYLRKLFCNIYDAQNIARENLINAKSRSKKYYDKKLNVKEFKVGDYVYLLKEPRKGKLCDQYIGPYRIIQTLKNNNVKLAISNNKIRIVHKDKLKIAAHQIPTTDHPHSGKGYIDGNRMEDRSLPDQP